MVEAGQENSKKLREMFNQLFDAFLKDKVKPNSIDNREFVLTLEN